MTRAAPARLLGLTDRGHLGVGAAADIAVYREDADREAMFTSPAYVFKDGATGRARRHARRRRRWAASTSSRPSSTAASRRRCAPISEAQPGRANFAHAAIGDDEICALLPRRQRLLPRRRAFGAPARSHGSGVMQINGVAIDDTFAEAFPMKATRLVITAHTPRVGRHAALSLTGLRDLGDRLRLRGRHRSASWRRDETPDGRPGDRGADVRDVGEGTGEAGGAARRAVRADLPDHGGLLRHRPGDEPRTLSKSPLGRNLRFFGDGWQISKVLGDTRYWRVPVMDGEFVCEETTADGEGVGGGNLLLLARDTDAALGAAEAAVAAMRRAAERHHAVSRRRGALGLEGRLQVRGAERLDQRRVLPDAASACSRESELTAEVALRAGDRHRRADRSATSPPRCAPASRQRGGTRRARRRAAHIGRQLRRQARAVPLPSARTGGERRTGARA